MGRPPATALPLRGQQPEECGREPSRRFLGQRLALDVSCNYLPKTPEARCEKTVQPLEVWPSAQVALMIESPCQLRRCRQDPIDFQFAMSCDEGPDYLAPLLWRQTADRIDQDAPHR